MSLILSGTDGLSDVDGSAATPAIRGTDANTGIFFPAADTIAFSEGGAEAMRITSSGNIVVGGVGNGTSSPFAAEIPDIDVEKTGYATIGARGYGTGAASGGVLVLGRSNSATLGTLTATTTGQYFGLIGFEGVNSSNAAQYAAYIQVAQDGTNGATYVPSNITFFTGTNAAAPAERMRIDSSGNVGIGVTTQNERLRLGSAAANQARITIEYNGSVLSYLGSYSGIVGSGNATDMLISATNVLAFASGGTTERMRITATGDVGIGTSSPQTKIQATGTSAGALVDVVTVRNTASDANSEVGIFFNPSDQTTNIRGARISAINNGGNNVGLKFYTGTGATITSKMTLDFSGNLGIGTVTPDANLTVNGAASFAAGTALLPSIARAGDLNTGIFFPAADTIAFSEGGAESMRIDSSGNLLVGKTSSALGTAGIEAQPVGYFAVTRAERPLVINRLTTDGDMIELYRDSVSKATLGVTSNSLTFGVAGSERMRIDSSGNVGIGTTSPSSKFDVVVTGAAQVTAIKARSNSAGTLAVSDEVSLDFQWYSTAYYGGRISGYIESTTGSGKGGLKFYTASTATSINATPSVTIDSSGNVGIGTSSPAVKLDFGITTNSTQIVNLRKNNNSIAGLGVNAEYGVRIAGPSDAAAPVSFGEISISDGTTFSEFMRLDSSGNLGIGTSSINTRLHVVGLNQTNGTAEFTPNASKGSNASYVHYGTNGDWYIRSASASGNVIIQDTGGNVGIGTSSPAGKLAVSDGTVIGEINPFSAASGCYIGTRSNHAVLFQVNASEKARIDTSGNLLVGLTSSTATPAQGVVLGGGNSSSGVYIGHANGTSSGDYYMAYSYNGSAIGSITQNGTTGVLYNLTSDYRLKNNPQALTGAKDFVMALQPKKWQWWDGSGEGVGFIAHEFMEVAKYSGNGIKDAVDADGKPVHQSIQPSSSEVMANLVAFIQEQQALITALTTRITALEST